jgi:hypothetical protein
VLVAIGPSDDQAEAGLVVRQQAADPFDRLVLVPLPAELLTRAADLIRPGEAVQSTAERLERVLELAELVTVLERPDPADLDHVRHRGASSPRGEIGSNKSRILRVPEAAVGTLVPGRIARCQYGERVTAAETS